MTRTWPFRGVGSVVDLLRSRNGLTPRQATDLRRDLLRAGFRLTYHGTENGIQSTRLDWREVGTVLITLDTKEKPKLADVLWRSARPRARKRS